MKQTIGFALSILAAVVLLAAFYSGPAQGAAEPAKDGKQIFLAQKCNVCHSVSSAGIERTMKSEKMAGPDLTNLAAKQDAATLTKYLHKQADINGKKHGKMFSGSDAELTALVSWLQEQKK